MKQLKVTSPFDNSLIQTIELNTQEQILQIIDNAYGEFNDYDKRLSKVKRIEILKKCARYIEENIEEITNLSCSEGGKPYIDSKVEIQRAINGIELAIQAIGNLEGKEIAMGHTLSSENKMAYTFKEPIGVVVAISAFNHPFNLAVHQVITAVAAGCPVIIKPASATPLSAIKLVGILHNCGLPKNLAQVVVCDKEDADVLVKSSKISYLTFIGSAKVGWHIRSIVAPGTRLALEHGGVAPVIVESDANINEMIPALIKGGFYHAGQVCVSVQKVFVHEDIIDEVIASMIKESVNLKVGNQLDKETQIGPLINQQEVNRIKSWVDEAVQDGAKILLGGNKISDSCFEPTIILNANDNSKVSTHEIFGPVICIYSYKDLDEAIKRSNALVYSFQAAIFTKNIDNAFKATKRLNAKTVMINEHTAFRVDWMPFGGNKLSGLGVGGIIDSINEMSNEKLVVFNSKEL